MLLLVCGCAPGGLWSLVIPEQRNLEIRDITQLPRANIPAVPPPPTVDDPKSNAVPQELSLDEAIRIALANTKVVRVLAGSTAVSSGQTIYDPAISNTQIDKARGVFDPNLNIKNIWHRTESPTAFADFTTPFGVSIIGPRTDEYDLSVGVSKKNVLGGTLGFDFADTHSRFQTILPGLFTLNPQNVTNSTLSYTQPLMQGAGIAANMAPIVIARLNTERSYFQYKDAMQDMVRGVIEAYWAVVFARTDVWAKKQQAEQNEAAFKRAEARAGVGLVSSADVAQARTALYNSRVALLTAQANQLQQEAALRNILGLPPTVPERFVPTSAPSTVRIDPNWEEVIRLAEDRRPDLIELKLIIEADQQSLLIAKNQALPKVDATMFYRWNGLEGETPSGARIGTASGQFTDWTLGVNFSVPLGLRAARADLRNAELLLMRDRANLDQGLHSALHILAGNMRNLAQFSDQYALLKESRASAKDNLDKQQADYRNGRTILLNVLQAISDWGTAVSAEAQALSQYNTELANLERQTGTILETHGVFFFEERYRSIGPLGRAWHRRPYPLDVVPGPNANRYPVGHEPADKGLEMNPPADPLKMPPPAPVPPRQPPPAPTAPVPPPLQGALPRATLLPPAEGVAPSFRKDQARRLKPGALPGIIVPVEEY
ncbi:MAG: TolC family protein [Planctomycetes bacterium]|nr:TolC family protein [Planctomycetota bacterium]